MNIGLAIFLSIGQYAFCGITPLSSDNPKAIDSNFSELALEVNRQSLKNGGTAIQNVKFSSSVQVTGGAVFSGTVKIDGNATSNSSFTSNGLASFAGGMVGPQIIQAWAHFVGTGTVVIFDSVGVSSVTDIGTGDYRVNFSTPFSTGDFIVGCTGGASAATGFVCARNVTERDPSSARITVVNSATANALDVDRLNVIFVGRR